MLTIHSPQWSSQHKAGSKLSPCFRSKRIPSENYSCSSNQNIKRVDSPTKYSEEIKRRKSQYLDRSACKRPVQTTQHILSSIQDLKEEYRKLKEAYKELIAEKLSNSHQITQLEKENAKLRTQNLYLKEENQGLRGGSNGSGSGSNNTYGNGGNNTYGNGNTNTNTNTNTNGNIVDSIVINGHNLLTNSVLPDRHNILTNSVLNNGHNVTNIINTQKLQGQEIKNNLLSVSLTSIVGRKEHSKVMSELSINHCQKKKAGSNKLELNREGSRLESGGKMELVQKIVQMQKKSKNKVSKPKKQQKQNSKIYKKKYKKPILINQ